MYVGFNKTHVATYIHAFTYIYYIYVRVHKITFGVKKAALSSKIESYLELNAQRDQRQQDLISNAANA